MSVNITECQHHEALDRKLHQWDIKEHEMKKREKRQKEKCEEEIRGSNMQAMKEQEIGDQEAPMWLNIIILTQVYHWIKYYVFLA